ncbi:MAG: hypothetical protein R3F39_14460 [Myxococcota bacterium]
MNHTTTSSPSSARTSALITIRGAARALLAPAMPPDWDLQSIDRIGPESVLLELGARGLPRILLEWHAYSGDPPPSVLRGPDYAAGYRERPDAWSLDDADTPSEVKRAAAAMLHLLARPPVPVALHAEPPPPADELELRPFGCEELMRWLAPTLAPGHELIDGWRLDDAYPFGPEEVAVAFAHPTSDEEPRIKVRLRADSRPAAHRTEQFDVLYTLPFGRGVDPERAELHRQLAAELTLHLEACDRRVRFQGPPRAPGQGAAGGVPSAHNLALPGPCYQHCSFCAVREEIDPAIDGDPAYIAALERDLAAAAARGTRVLRVNGLEPLRASFVFDLLDVARHEGFEEFHILSTFLPAADRAVAERLVRSLPGRYRFYVPIYGSCPEVHDAVTGLPGSFATLMRAVRNLRELIGGSSEGGEQGRQGELIFTTVLTSENLGDVRAMADLVRPLGRWWEVHLPFPNTSSRRDGYHQVAVQMSRALQALYPAGWAALGDLPLGEVVPCIAWAHQRATGHALVTPERLQRRQREPSGTYYQTIGFTHSLGGGRPVAFTAATTPCPHLDRCALSQVCPGKVYTAYAQRFGLDELRPVALAELQQHPAGPELLAAVAAEAATA